MAKVLPLLELPFHLNLLVFNDLSVLTLNSIIEELILSANLQLGDGLRLAKLAHHCLVGEGLVDDVRWHIICDVDFDFLWHFFIY